MLDLLNQFFIKLRTKEGLLLAFIVCLIVFIGYKFWQKYQTKSIEDDAKATPIVEGMEGASKEDIEKKPKKRGVYFDMAVGEKEVGRVKIELFDSVVPKTCENFRGLCIGQKDEKSGRVFKPYMGTLFHRLIPGFMIQGGDYENGNGTGGNSIWGGKFADESFESGKHSSEGFLSMANSGPNSNGSQFFITLGAAPHLDGKHVVFGKVVEGLDIVKNMQQIRTDDNDRPQADIMILDCGETYI